MRLEPLSKFKTGARYIAALLFAIAILSVATLAFTGMIHGGFICMDCGVTAGIWVDAGAPEKCSFTVTGSVTVEGEPAKRLLLGLAFTSRSSNTHAKTVTDDGGRFSLIDPGPSGCYGTERYIAVADTRYLVRRADSDFMGRNIGPVSSGDEIEIDLVPFRVN